METSKFSIPLYRTGVVIGAIYNIVLVIFMAMYPYTIVGAPSFNASTLILTFVCSGVHGLLLILDGIKICCFRFKYT